MLINISQGMGRAMPLFCHIIIVKGVLFYNIGFFLSLFNDREHLCIGEREKERDRNRESTLNRVSSYPDPLSPTPQVLGCLCATVSFQTNLWSVMCLPAPQSSMQPTVHLHWAYISLKFSFSRYSCSIHVLTQPYQTTCK